MASSRAKFIVKLILVLYPKEFKWEILTWLAPHKKIIDSRISHNHTLMATAHSGLISEKHALQIRNGSIFALSFYTLLLICYNLRNLTRTLKLVEQLYWMMIFSKLFHIRTYFFVALMLAWEFRWQNPAYLSTHIHFILWLIELNVFLPKLNESGPWQWKQRKFENYRVIF